MFPLIVIVVLFLNNLISNLSSVCNVDFKVYVYETPLLELSEDYRPNDTFAGSQQQYSLGLIVYNYFNHFCGRTLNPDEADYFYLPQSDDVLFHVVKKGTQSYTQQAFMAVINDEFDSKFKISNITNKYWLRNSGSDHIIVIPAPLIDMEQDFATLRHYVSSAV